MAPFSFVGCLQSLPFKPYGDIAQGTAATALEAQDGSAQAMCIVVCDGPAWPETRCMLREEGPPLLKRYMFSVRMYLYELEGRERLLGGRIASSRAASIEAAVLRVATNEWR